MDSYLTSKMDSCDKIVTLTESGVVILLLALLELSSLFRALELRLNPTLIHLIQRRPMLQRRTEVLGRCLEQLQAGHDASAAKERLEVRWAKSQGLADVLQALSELVDL